MKKIERKIGIFTFKFVLVVGLLIAMAGSANAITFREDFEAGYFDGVEIHYHRGWFQSWKTNEMTYIDDAGAPGSAGNGLTKGEYSFIWIAHPFSWKQLIVDDYIILQMDFETDGSAHFDDDRLGWITKDDDSSSANIFGVQLDPDDGGYNIECYWRNSSNDRVDRSIVTLPSLTANTWYRLEGKFTKISATSTEIDVKLWALSDLVNPIASGNIANTSAISPENDRPDTKYFTADTIWPVFKNYDSINGNADNAYFHIEDGIDDVAEVEVTDNLAEEGGGTEGTGKFEVQLLNAPPEEVTVTVTCWPIINAMDVDLGSGRGQSHDLTFTYDDYDDEVTVTAYNDDELEKGEVAWIDFSISSTDASYHGCDVVPLPVKINVIDNDGSDHLDKGPYLIYPSDPTYPTNMTALWQMTSSSTGYAKLKWGKTQSYSDGSANLEESGDRQYEHTMTQLDAGTKYYYQITETTSDWQPVGGTYLGSFYTPSTGDNVKFLVYGDTRAGGAEGVKAYCYDAVCLGIMETLAIDPDYQTFLLHVGDWVQKGRSESSWTDEYFNREFSNARSILANLPVQGCQGNHELNYYSGQNNGDLYLKYWPYPYYEENVKYGSFNYGPVHVAVVDTEDSMGLGSDQDTWLKGDMYAATQKWKVILLHKPGWSAGGHGDNTSVQDLIDRLESHLEGKPGTDIVFAGHNHYYARCKKDTVHHITAGGGGAPLNTPNPTHTAQVVEVKKAFSFCEIDIRDNVLYLIARNREGSIIDAFALAKDGTPETWSFIVKDSSDNVVAWFDNLGNLALEGSLTEDTTPTASANDEFRVQDSGGDVAIIDATNGNMTIEGFLYQEQDMSQLSEEGFIVKNSSGDVVAFIDNWGDMYLKGALFDFPD